MLDLLIVSIALVIAFALNIIGRQKFNQGRIKARREVIMYIGLGFLGTGNILFVLGFFMFYMAGLMGLPVSGWALAAAIDIVAFGSIFLGAYIFSTTIKKRNQAFLLSIAMLCAFFVIINGALYFVQGPVFEEQRILQIGLPGKATLLEIEPTGVMVNEQPRVRLLWEVRPDQGASYETEIYMVISPVHLPKFAPGAVFNIKYDPEDRNKIAIESVVETRQ